MSILVGSPPRLPLGVACVLALTWAFLVCAEVKAGLTVDTAEPPQPPPAKSKPQPAAKKPPAQTKPPAPPAAQAKPPAPVAVQTKPPAPAAVQTKPPAPVAVQSKPASPAHAKPTAPAAAQSKPSAPAQTAAATPAATLGKLIEHYLELVKHEIIGAWHPPTDKKSGNPVVTFTVNRSGSISNVQITTSSGDRATDALAVKTLMSLSPFDPLPHGSPEAVWFEFTFMHVDLSHGAGEEGEDEVFRKRRRARKYPHDGKAAFEYARALRFADRAEEAADELRRAMEVGYPKGPCLLELGHASKKLGQQSDAENYFKESIKESPDLSAAHRYLGDLYYEQKRWGDALASYRDFLKLQPSGPVSELANMCIQLCQRHLEGSEGGEE